MTKRLYTDFIAIHSGNKRIMYKYAYDARINQKLIKKNYFKNSV